MAVWKMVLVQYDVKLVMIKRKNRKNEIMTFPPSLIVQK